LSSTNFVTTSSKISRYSRCRLPQVTDGWKILLRRIRGLHTHTHAHAHKHTRTHTHTLTHFLSLSPSYTYYLPFSSRHYTHKHTLTFIPPLSLHLSSTHTHTHAHTRTHTHNLIFFSLSHYPYVHKLTIFLSFHSLSFSSHVLYSSPKWIRPDFDFNVILSDHVHFEMLHQKQRDIITTHTLSLLENGVASNLLCNSWPSLSAVYT
jgi:hypothetical protein